MMLIKLTFSRKLFIVTVLLILSLYLIWLNNKINNFYVNLAQQPISDFNIEESQPVYISTDNSATTRLFNTIPIEQDDALALAVLLKAHREEKIRILGISSTFGNTNGEQTYKITKNQIELSNISLPVVKGANQSGQTDSSAVAEIIKTLQNSDQKVMLIALGPVTDYAAVLKIHPELIDKVKMFYFVRSGPYYSQKRWYLNSFNAMKDKEAAEFLYTLPIPKVAIDKNITKITLNNSNIHTIQKNTDPMIQFISKDLSGWNRVNKLLPNPGYIARKGNMIPWDVVWSMYFLQPELFEAYETDWGLYLKIKDTKTLQSSIVEEVSSF